MIFIQCKIFYYTFRIFVSIYILNDKKKSTIGGRVLGGVAAITGVILIAMPVSLLANNYASVYNFKSKKLRVIKIYKIKNSNEKTSPDGEANQ